jgi:hypothetical protein
MTSAASLQRQLVASTHTSTKYIVRDATAPSAAQMGRILRRLSHLGGSMLSHLLHHARSSHHHRLLLWHLTSRHHLLHHLLLLWHHHLLRRHHLLATTHHHHLRLLLGYPLPPHHHRLLRGCLRSSSEQLAAHHPHLAPAQAITEARAQSRHDSTADPPHTASPGRTNPSAEER